MVGTFILYRTFAISALLYGASPFVNAAPINPPANARFFEERNCRIIGCMFAEPSSSISLSVPMATATAVSSSPVAVETLFPTDSSLADELLDILEMVSSSEQETSTNLSADLESKAAEPEVVEIEIPAASPAVASAGLVRRAAIRSPAEPSLESVLGSEGEKSSLSRRFTKPFYLDALDARRTV
ncbi:hypothetical protein AcV7_001855 [Taiwanofungus camphoratus]|nr:hypothetical protein AcV7_001855 [Antrodia cinnamomea]